MARSLKTAIRMRMRTLVPLLIGAALGVILVVPASRHRAAKALRHVSRTANSNAEARSQDPGQAASDSSRGTSGNSSSDHAGRATETGGSPDAGRAARLPVAGVVVQPGPFVLTAHGTGRAAALQRAQVACRV